jgi:hypothetical protein
MATDEAQEAAKKKLRELEVVVSYCNMNGLGVVMHLEFSCICKCTMALSRLLGVALLLFFSFQTQKMVYFQGRDQGGFHVQTLL